MIEVYHPKLLFRVGQADVQVVPLVGHITIFFATLFLDLSPALLSALGCVKHCTIAFEFEQKRSEYLTNIIPDLNLFIPFRTILVSC